MGEWTKQLTHEWTSEQTWEQKRKVTSAVEECIHVNFGSCSRDTNFWWIYVLSVVIEQTGLNYENLSPRHTKL